MASVALSVWTSERICSNVDPFGIIVGFPASLSKVIPGPKDISSTLLTRPLELLSPA